MSQYITSTISKNISTEVINNIAKKYNLVFTQIQNLFVERQLQDKNIKYYLVEWIDNKYDTAIGKLMDNDTMENVLKGLFSNFADLSNDFIIDLKKDIYDREQEILKNQINLVQFLQEFLVKNYCDGIGLILHSYKGHVKNEKIKIRKCKKMILQDIELKHIIGNIEEDTLYMFLRQG